MKDLIAQPQDLICPPDAIFDTAEVASLINAAVLEAKGDTTVLQKSVVSILSDRLKSGRAAIAEGFTARPFASRPTVRAYSWLTDCIILTALDVVTNHIHPLSNPTDAERITVFSVGEYGRGEMAPQSDVDLLFLTPYKIAPWAESVIESMLYILWDLRLKVGHASRTIRDCLRLGSDDFTIRTALLENRFLAGDDSLAAKLNQRLRDDLFKGTERQFTEAKLEERDARHEKQGERYMVEPNVKEGKGGLRDLQSLFWIAKYLHRVKDV